MTTHLPPLPPLSDYAATPEQIAAYRKAMREWLDDESTLPPPENPDSDRARADRRDAALGITYTTNTPRGTDPWWHTRRRG